MAVKICSVFYLWKFSEILRKKLFFLWNKKKIFFDDTYRSNLFDTSNRRFIYAYNNGWYMCDRIVSHFTRISYCNTCVCRILCCATLLFCIRALINMMAIQVDKVGTLFEWNYRDRSVKHSASVVSLSFNVSKCLKLRYQLPMFVRFVGTWIFYRFRYYAHRFDTIEWIIN